MSEEIYKRGISARLNDIDLYYVDEGDGEPVLLLHGFPDSALLWRKQIPVLLDAGYRVIAPDLRGFGKSSRPEGVEAYSIVNAFGDVAALLDELKIESAHVVGHDWGAGVAWGLAAFLPPRTKTLTALSVGHPLALGDKTNLDQLAKGWYMLFFQYEGVAEEFLSRNDWEWSRRWLEGEIDLDRYIEDLARPGALTAALNWYRANASPTRWLDPPMDWPPIEVPVMGVWSTGDFGLTERQMVETEKYVSGPWRYERIDAPSHWIPLHAPDELNTLLLDFLTTAN